MMLLKVMIGLGTLLGLVALAKASPGAAASVPAKSEPEGGDFGTPVKTLATAASGRTYTVWMYPPTAKGLVYTIAQLAGSIAWVAFLYNGTTNTSIPAKTNVSDAALLALLKIDWRLPA